MSNMPPTAARAARRDRLQTAISSRGRCIGTDPDLFFRSDSEDNTVWAARRAAAQAFCASCPAQAACLELALRDGDGTGVDDMVRAGVTGRKLVALRRRDRREIAAAVAADRDDQWDRLVELTVAVRAEAARMPDTSRAQDAQNARMGGLVAEAQAIRTDRRARVGWSTAA